MRDPRTSSSRAEREERARRARAHAHLARVRAGRTPRAAGGAGRRRLSVAVPSTRGLAAGALAVALLSGFASGDAFLATAAAFSGSPGAVEVIAVRGARHLSAEEVARATGVSRGAPLAAIEIDAVVDQLEDHDWIAAARALRLPGGAVVVHVEESRPLALVEVDGPGVLFAVDAEGRPFAPADGDAFAELPRLVPDGSVTPREASGTLATALRIAQRLAEHGLAQPRSIAVPAEDDPEGFTLQLRDRDARIVLGRDDLDTRIGNLAQLLAARSDEVDRAREVDLRFADQVVLREKSTRQGSAQATGSRGRAGRSEKRPSG
jgi:cell division septal protein FtsQ